MPYLIAAVFVLALGVATVFAVYRADTRARADRDRDCSRTTAPPPSAP